MAKISISLNGLGMDRKNMRDLVNRMNQADPNGKWVLEVKEAFPYMNQLQNPFINYIYYGK